MLQSTLLIVNAAASVSRNVVSIFVGLYVVRVVIQVLGPEDYGMLVALGASSSLLLLLTAALRASAQRHMAYELGTGDQEAGRAIFGTVLVVYLLGGLILWLAGLALGPLVLSALQIPQDRQHAAFWVYHATVLTYVVKTWSTPFQAAACAHQAMVLVAVFDMFIVLSRLGAALALWVITHGDLLVWYVVLVLIGNVVVNLALAVYCMARFPEARTGLTHFQLTHLREVAGFAGWTLVGILAFRLRMQGGIVLLNIMFGPLITAAYAIAIQISAPLGNLGNTLQRVTNPALVVAEARGNRDQVNMLALLSSKYATIVTSLVVIPLMIVTEELMHLWLGQTPEYTVTFVRLVMVWTFLNQMSQGHATANQAEGDIGWYTRILTVLAIVSLAVPTVAFMVFKAGPWVLPATSILMYMVMTYIRVVGIGRQLDLPVGRWFRGTVWPVAVVVLPATVVAAVVGAMMSQGTDRVLAVTLAYAVVALPMTVCFGLKHWERKHFKRVMSVPLRMVTGRATSAKDNQLD